MSLTTLKEFAEAFDCTALQLFFLLVDNIDFYSQHTVIEPKAKIEQIQLKPKAVDELEEAIEGDKTLWVKLETISQITGASIEDILDVTKKANPKGKYKNCIKKDEIKFSCLRDLMLDLYAAGIKFVPTTTLLQKKKTTSPKKKSPAKSTTPTSQKSEKPDTTPLNKESEMERTTTSTDVLETNIEEKVATESATTSSVVEVQEDKAPTPVKTTAAPKKKKKKGTATKNDILAISNEALPIKNVRSFALSAGLFELKELAVMSDEELTNALDSKYIFLPSQDRTIVIEKDALLSIQDSVYIIE